VLVEHDDGVVVVSLPEHLRPTPFLRGADDAVRCFPSTEARMIEDGFRTGRFAGKTALVTGSSRGIGRRVAMRLAAEGASVVVHSSSATADSVRDEIRRDGGTAVSVQSDLTRTDGVHRAVDTVIDEFGRIDVLVNNAGGSVPGKLATVEEDAYDWMFALNAKAVFLAMKRVIPLMVDQGGGAIVNVSSIGGAAGLPNYAAYNGAKHAVRGFTKTAAIEYGPLGVRVNAVALGVHRTGLASSTSGSLYDAEAWRTRLATFYPAKSGELAEPDEAAGPIVFLCGDDASNIHGAILPVDSGYLAQ
jgi:NAD(P)-dependent dehydrogenase (short-subunit alcohol dehydrogenase family)